MPQIKIVIIGAGLGGLCLAHSLRNSGIDVEIYERDASPWDRPQGYRLHLEADALNALREVLPADLHRLFEATAMRTTPLTTILKTDLSVLKQLPTDDGKDLQHWPENASPEQVHCNVDRATLRQLLLSGLEENSHFGKKLTHYVSTTDGVTAHFEDGTTAQADLLVGADGIRSAVRQQRAPHAELMDAGVQAIYGRLPWNPGSSVVPPQVLEDIFAVASNSLMTFLGLGAVKFPMLPQQAADELAPHIKLRDQEDYLVCIVGGRPENFPGSPHGTHDKSSEELQLIALERLGDWPSQAQEVIAKADSSSFFVVDMYSSVPFDLDAPSNVTLLGDAIHAMTPTLGRGANLAMRDGALLGRQIKVVAEYKQTIPQALAQYEKDMVEYGFKVVRESVETGEARMGQNPLPK